MTYGVLVLEMPTRDNPIREVAFYWRFSFCRCSASFCDAQPFSIPSTSWSEMHGDYEAYGGSCSSPLWNQ